MFLKFRAVKSALLSLSLLLLAVISTGCFTENDSDSSLSVKKYDALTMAVVNNIIDSRMAAGKIPGAIVGIWEAGYETQLISKGLADISTGRVASASDRFRIASNSKMFTAMALLILADEKRIGLDDKVSKYINDFPYTDQVSVRQLANHTSGYFNYTEDPAFTAAGASNMLRRWAPREMLEYIKNRPLNFTPGTNYSYSNTNYILMGLIIETVTGQKWEDYITARIINPLMLSETSYPKDASIAGSHLKGYNVEGAATVEIVVDPSMGWAAGGLVSTLNDMKKWLDALAAHTLISPKMFDEQMKCVMDPTSNGSYEYGFGVARVWAKYIGHTGVIPGYNSAAFISRDGKQAIIVVCNNEEGGVATSMAFQIVKYLFK